MKNKVLALLSKSVKDLDISTEVELTPAKGHGDFSTNIAMKAAKELGRPPRDIAEEIVKNTSADFIEKLEVAGPGFINIFLKGDALGSIVQEILEKGDEYGRFNEGNSYNIEYISANPTGFLHVGHARNASLGQTLANVLKFAGNNIEEEYWINDAGSQMDTLGEAVYIRYQQEFGSAIKLPENTYKGKDIVFFAKEIVEEFGDEYKGVPYEECKEWFRTKGKEIALKYIKEHISLLGVKMDIWSSEQDVRNTEMENYINKLADTYEKDGALWLETTKHGDDKDRVIRKSNGEWTYFAPDIAYHNIKANRGGGHNKIINIWGSDHIGYVQRVKTALDLSGQPKDILEVLTIQFVNLLKDGKELKMSKRLGTSFTVKELVDLIGKDATRFNMIAKSNNSTITFDVNDVVKKSSENPVFTIQYTHARSNQLINKSEHLPIAGQYSDSREVALINQLALFPELVKLISKNYKVHLLTQYLMDLSSTFNSFYSNVQVIGNEREAEMIGLVRATKHVLANCLKLIGVSAPDKM